MTKLKTNIILYQLLVIAFLSLITLAGNTQSVYDTVSTAVDEEQSSNKQEIKGADDKEEAGPVNNQFERQVNSADTVNWRTFSPGFIDSLKNNKQFDYVKNGIPLPQQKPITNLNRKPFVLNNLLLYLAVFVFVAFLVWYLVKNNFIIFRRKPTIAKDEKIEEPGTKDIFSIQYNQSIEKALANKNYRLAIRLHYLQLLKIMAGKNIIKYRPDRTNFDYLTQLRPTDYYEKFFSVTRNYEYSWYGLFDISEEQYRKMEKGFEDILKRV